MRQLYDINLRWNGSNYTSSYLSLTQATDWVSQFVEAAIFKGDPGMQFQLFVTPVRVNASMDPVPYGQA